MIPEPLTMIAVTVGMLIANDQRRQLGEKIDILGLDVSDYERNDTDWDYFNQTGIIRSKSDNHYQELG